MSEEQSRLGVFIEDPDGIPNTSYMKVNRGGYKRASLEDFGDKTEQTELSEFEG